MLDTILIDLDGTLLPMGQEEFVSAYLRLLTGKLAPLGLEPRDMIDALWQGTAAMIQNDGSAPNSHRFWEGFQARFALPPQKLEAVRAACDSFYENEFNQVQAHLRPTGGAPARAIAALRSKGYRLALATNPIFPPQAVTSRLGWVGLAPEDFVLTTDYHNSRFCKPNLEYYRDVLCRLGARPEQCMMVGNSVAEDLCAGRLGMALYLVTGFAEGFEGEPGALCQNHGSIEDFAAFAQALPDLKGL